MAVGTYVLAHCLTVPHPVTQVHVAHTCRGNLTFDPGEDTVLNWPVTVRATGVEVASLGLRQSVNYLRLGQDVTAIAGFSTVAEEPVSTI